MNGKRLYSIAVIAAILGPAVWAGVPRPQSFSWYWPFMDYPMYSRAHYPGEDTWKWEFRVGACDETVPTTRLTPAALHITAFRMIQLLESGADSTHPRVRTLLGRIAREQEAATCRGEIWARRYQLGTDGIVDRRPAWQRVTVWQVRDSDVIE